MEYQVAFTVKDLILYALSVGVGSCPEDVDREKKFLDEGSPEFCAFPTFPLILTFWAGKGRTGTDGIPAFPPPMLVDDGGVIPTRFHRKKFSLSNSPVLHVFQSIEWSGMFPIPAKPEANERHDTEVDLILRTRTLSVKPKSIGTFVTSEAQVSQRGDERILCRLQSTALVGGVSKDSVNEYDCGAPTAASMGAFDMSMKPAFQWKYRISPTQTFLYRIASGDSNRIHIDGDEPLLHGLCTFGIIFRAFALMDSGNTMKARKMGAKFVKPIFLGDEIIVKIWQASTPHEYRFVVDNTETDERLVDHGFFQCHQSSKL